MKKVEIKITFEVEDNEEGKKLIEEMKEAFSDESVFIDAPVGMLNGETKITITDKKIANEKNFNSN